MNKTLASFFFCLAAPFLLTTPVFAHCEIPCGIYDDQMRIELIREHAATIEKSMSQILLIEKEKDHHANQLVRWIVNKEDHADKLQEVVSQYFMTQRIKPDTRDYEKKITLLHQMLISAMKCKQTTDIENVRNLLNLTEEFQKLYFQKE